MIEITKDKIYYVNSKKKKKVVSPAVLYTNLHEAVVIGKGVTFERIMNILKEAEPLTSIIFHSLIGGKFDLFYKDMMAPLRGDDKFYKKEQLEVYVINDLWKFKKKGPIEYGFYFDVHLTKPKEKEAYGLSFLPLNVLRYCKVVIEKKCVFHVNDTTIPIDVKNYKPLLETEMTSMRLFDFITGILYEIGWHGYPTERDERSDELSNRMKDYKEGKVVATSFDDMLAKLKKKKKTTKKKKSTSKK